MESPKISIYIETMPENYVSNIGLTISCKHSQKWIAELLKEMIESLEGFDFNQ